MDKLIETPWFVKVVALLLAALLYISVNFEPDNARSFNTPSQKDSVVVEAVPVEVYYDRDNLVVTGVPKTVNVTLHGPKNLVLPAKSSREFKVLLDLSDPEIELGKRKVPFKIRDLNDKITATIEPQYANISIQEKVTKEFSVQPEINQNLVDDGYLVGTPKVKPEKVKITGAKDTIEKITYVKAVVNLDDDVKDTVEVKAQVQALDKDYNKLNVTVNPGSVNVTVPVKIPSKEVKVMPAQSGNPKDGVKISGMTADPPRITLYGKQSVLDSIDQLQLSVDISKIEESTTMQVPVDLPDGVAQASVQKVSVMIEAKKSTDKEDGKDDEKAETETNPPDDETVTNEPTPPANEGNVDETTDLTKTFSGVKIRFNGLGEEYELAFLSPAQGATNVTATGAKGDINSLKPSEIQASINVAGLQEGEHSVPLAIRLPNNIKGQAADSMIKVSIIKKNVEASTDQEKVPSDS
ncbi:CdaR family protein [Bacillus testis]|uniref:CdaR family protein n=1 Tax=Bacillus testis TaxID=1622072 RepID=UPI00067E7469|nr:CdaR family protein [Bacillus testis]